MKKFNILLTSVIFFTILVSSCNQSDIGIFYGIEKEEKIVDRSLENNLTIGAMAKLGTNLYIAAGKVYRKASGTNNEWAKLSTPSGYDLCTSLTVFEDTTIFAVWFDKDTADTAFLKSTDGSSWTTVAGTFSGEFTLVKSAHAGINDGVMVVSTTTGSNTGNYYTTVDGTTFNSISGENALGGHFDIDHDGSNYWFLTKTDIYEETDNDLSTLPASSLDYEDVDSDSDNDEYFRYILADNASGNIYVSREWGEFSFYNGTWNNNIEDINLNVNDMIVFTINSTPTFFVGTYSWGYYEPSSPGLSISDLDDPDSDSISCDYQTYSASDLRKSAILGFFVDGDELYALTYGKGLWKNIDDSGERRWERE